MKSSTDSTFYTICDYLGSIMVVADENGTSKEEYSYDAWGRRRNKDNWTYSSVSAPTYITRGYTGHEHIEEVGLINMNGRVYDPLVGLFLSPDPVIQSPYDVLNYNRYSYVGNNPLKYTDPSGYFKVSEFIKQHGYRWPDDPYNNWYTFDNDHSGGSSGSYGGSTGTGGGGISEVAAPLLSSGFGGSWTPDAGYHFFSMWEADDLTFNMLEEAGVVNIIFNGTVGSRYDRVVGYHIKGSDGKLKYVDIAGSNFIPFYGVGKIIFPEVNANGGDAQNGGASTFDPTLTNKFTTEVFVTPGVTTEGYTTRTTHKGRSSTELVLSATTGKIESVSTKTPLGNLSVGSDGSWTFGTNLSVGTDTNGNLILDMSLPWFNGNSIGTTIKLSKEPWENIGNYLKSIEYHPAPVYPVPYYLIPAFAL